MIDRASDAHREAVEAWRRERYSRLLSDTGWLTLAGLGWLKAGVNTIGSADDADVVLPGGPLLAGTVTVDGIRATADGVFRNGGAAGARPRARQRR